MHKTTPLQAIVLVLGLAAWQGSAAQVSAGSAALLERLRSVEADPALSAAALRQGAKVAAVCANCHGANGISPQQDTPNLAGQHPRYLLEQMQKFADGRRRFEFMEKLIKAMKPDERVAAVLFYARQAVPPRPVDDAALRARGKAYFDQVCFRCHGSDGRGSDAFARLAGQQAAYVTLALKRYRNNTDGARNDPLMAAATRLMSDADIQAVAAYVSSLP
jgi:cytochrome c553